MKSPKRRILNKHVSKKGGTFDTDEDLRAQDSNSPHSSRLSGDIEALSDYRIKKEGLAEEIELFQVPNRNAPSYDLGTVVVEDFQSSNNIPEFSFQSVNFEPMSSFHDKITPLRTNKVSKKWSASKSNQNQIKSVKLESDAFDELASRRTVLFSPIHVPKSAADINPTSSYNYEIIDQSLKELMSSVDMRKA